MDRLLCSIVLLVLVAHSWSLVIKDADINKAEDQQQQQQQRQQQQQQQLQDIDINTEALSEDQLRQLRDKYQTMLDQAIIKRKTSALHPFSFGLRRYKTRDHPEDHPFGFGQLKDERKLRGDHPFGWSAKRTTGMRRDHPFGFQFGAKKDSSRRAYDALHRDNIVVSDDSAQWVDERQLRE